MKIEIVTIGDELLLGSTLDTNSAYLGRRLAEIGGRVTYRTTVGDEGEEIQEVLERAFERADLVFTTGGLGPTRDDVTKKTVSKILDLPLILHERTLTRVKEHFEKRGIQMPSINTTQALIPRGSTLLDNPLGTAPGIWISWNSKDLILLPGVPAELKAIFENILPKLREKINGEVLLHSTLHSTGIPESEIAERLSAVLKGREREWVSYLPGHTGVDIRITIQGKGEKEVRGVLKGMESKVSETIGISVWGKNEDTLERVIGVLLTMKGQSISVAESCTGGLIMDRLTSIPGSSQYFYGGIVAYSNDLKNRVLKVPKGVLSRYGAVSRETALSMAERVRDWVQTDVGLSVTGIAGPTGGSEEKPVGLVYFGLSGFGKGLWEEHRFLGDRRMIKEQSAQGALDLLRRTLLNNG